MVAPLHRLIRKGRTLVKRIGIFGGSFDPVHVGHLRAAIEAKEQLKLDRLLLVPAGKTSHKGKASPVLPARTRLNALRKAFNGLEWARIWTGELLSTKTPFTIDTVMDIKGEFGAQNRYFLIIGSDWSDGIHHWKDSARLLKEVRIAVCSRKSGERLKGVSRDFIRIEMPAMEVSSSEIRARMKKGLELRGLIPFTTLKR